MDEFASCVRTVLVRVLSAERDAICKLPHHCFGLRQPKGHAMHTEQRTLRLRLHAEGATHTDGRKAHNARVSAKTHTISSDCIGFIPWADHSWYTASARFESTI